MTPNITVTMQYGTVDLIDSVADEWRALADQSAHDQPFYRPEFIAACVRSSSQRRVLLVSARIGGALKAVLALVEERALVYGIPAKKLRSPANASRFDLTKADGAEGDAALQAIWQELKTLKTYDFIELWDVPEQSFAEQLTAAASADGFAVGRWISKEVPHIPLQQPGTRPWLNLARESLVETVDRSTRKIMRERGAVPVLDRRLGYSKELLEEFYAIEAAGWKGRNRTAISSQKRTLAFHNEIAAAGAAQGYFCIDSLYCKDTLVAAAFSFVHRKRYFALKWSYNEEFHKYAPGHLLINAVLERCFREGYEEFDFMGEKFDYEARWTPLSRQHAFLYIFKPGFKGRLIENLKFRVVPRFKRWRSRFLHTK